MSRGEIMGHPNLISSVLLCSKLWMMNKEAPKAFVTTLHLIHPNQCYTLKEKS